VSLVGISAIAMVSLYVYANLLIVAAAAMLAGIRALSGALPRPLTYGHLLALGRILAVTGLLLPLLAMWHGGLELTPLKAQVWAAPSMHAAMTAVPNDARFDVGIDAQHASLPVNAATTVVLMIFASGLLLTLLPVVAELAATLRVIRDAHVLRSIGAVRILVSDKEQVPFAVWIPGRSYIVLPLHSCCAPLTFAWR
jgi:hypothetical protein